MRARFLVAAAALAVIFTGCFSSSADDSVRVVAFFEDVGDLVERGQVQVNSVEVGSIDSIQLVTEDGKMRARVEMTLFDDIQVPAEGIEALVRQTSLLGEQFVDLVPNDDGPPFLSAGSTTIPVESTDRLVDVETVLSDVSSFIGKGGFEDLSRLTHAQAVILEDRSRRLGEVLDELSTFTEVLSGRRQDIAAAIDSLASATTTLADNRARVDRFLDSLEDANALLASQSGEFGRLFRSFQRFGKVNVRFLVRHQDAIARQFRALRPILGTLVGVQGELRTDITQLRTFFELFPKSLGGGPGGRGHGDYVQAEAILCEVLEDCNTGGERGDVPGQGS